MIEKCSFQINDINVAVETPFIDIFRYVPLEILTDELEKFQVQQ